MTFNVILKALEVLHNKQDTKARGFISRMLKFEFIIGHLLDDVTRALHNGCSSKESFKNGVWK